MWKGGKKRDCGVSIAVKRILPLAVVVLVCGIAVVFVDQLVSNRLRERLQKVYDLEAAETATLLQRTLDHHLDVLESIAVFITLKQGDL